MDRLFIGLRQFDASERRAGHRPRTHAAAVPGEPGVQLSFVGGAEISRVTAGRPEGRLLFYLRAAFPDCHMALHLKFGR